MPPKKSLLAKYKNKQVRIIDRYMLASHEGKLLDFDQQFALIESEGKEWVLNMHEILGIREVEVADES